MISEYIFNYLCCINYYNKDKTILFIFQLVIHGFTEYKCLANIKATRSGRIEHSSFWCVFSSLWIELSWSESRNSFGWSEPFKHYIQLMSVNEYPYSAYDIWCEMEMQNSISFPIAKRDTDQVSTSHSWLSLQTWVHTSAWVKHLIYSCSSKWRMHSSNWKQLLGQSCSITLNGIECM